jgi:protoheme IX farnesyltransferase
MDRHLTSTESAATIALGSDAAISRAEAGRAGEGILRIYCELTKARLSSLVLVTTGVGFLLATVGPVDWLRLLWTVVGTGLAAGCAAVLNQILEIELDRRMDRTRNRPLPAGMLSRAHAWVAGLIMGAGGVAVLGLMVHELAAWLALFTILLYILLYTPLKTRSTLNTFIGAVCGAIPPMIGWVAAAGRLELGAWVLGAILLIWQIPHFFALAWLYRQDYARGGFAMLPSLDPDGDLTCRVILLTSMLLLPLSLLVTLLHISGCLYAGCAVLLGVWMIVLSLKFLRARTDANARAVFIASITYLPLLLALMVIDKGPGGQSVLWKLIGG